MRLIIIINSTHPNREQGQGTADELRQRDFRKELEEREAKATGKSIPAVVRRAIEANQQSVAKKAKLDHPQGAITGGSGSSGGNIDQDDPVDADSSSDDDSDEEDDDDTAALLEELNKIKSERAQQSAQKEQERKQDDERIRMENILSGNPLLTYSGDGKTADLKVITCFLVTLISRQYVIDVFVLHFHLILYETFLRQIIKNMFIN